MPLAKDLSYILLGEDRTASKAMNGAEATAQKVTGRIGGAFSKLGGIIGGEFGGVLDQAGAGIEHLGGKGAKLSTVLETVGAVGTAAGIGLMQLGSSEQQATAGLNAAITQTGDSVGKYQEHIDKAIASGEKYGFSAEDTKGALASLTITTGSTDKALSHMSVVTDLAAKRHISLSAAADLVAKILAGSGTRTLTQYGIHLDKSKDKTAAAEGALTQLSAKLSGQASASMVGFGGFVDQTRTKVTDWVKEVAGPAGAALSAFSPLVGIAGIALDIYKTKQAAATVADVERTGAAIGATAATVDETAAQVGLDVAMDANPILGVVGALTGLAALIGGGLLLEGTKHNTKATADFTQALKDNASASDKDTRAIAFNALEKDGALKAGQKLGLSARQMVDASLGQAGAVAAVNAILGVNKKRLDEQTNGMDKAVGAATRMTQAQKDLGNNIDAVGGSIASVNAQYKGQTAHQKLFNSAVDDTAKSAGNAAGQVGSLADQMHRLGANSPGALKVTVTAPPPKKHAAGGSFIANSATYLTPNDIVGEAGPERVDITPLNAGRKNSGGGGDVNVNITLSGVSLSPMQDAQRIHGALVNLYKSSGSKTELKRALGLA